MAPGRDSADIKNARATTVTAHLQRATGSRECVTVEISPGQGQVTVATRLELGLLVTWSSPGSSSGFGLRMGRRITELTGFYGQFLFT